MDAPEKPGVIGTRKITSLEKHYAEQKRTRRPLRTAMEGWKPP
jgi:hypothetical protein